ncbi:MAG: hypothetical protein NVS4B2_33790 [Chloroflexota bacterium]
MWNTAISGTETIPPERPTTYKLLRSGALEQMFRDRLPSAWTVNMELDQRREGPDAIMQLRAPGGETADMIVEVRTGVAPRDVPTVANQLGRYGSGPALVVAPFLPLGTQESLKDRGIGYADATGNMRVAVDRPAVFIREVGLKSDPWRQERSIRSLKGPTASRVVRALCDFRPPYGVRELAQRSGTAPASVSRVISFLEPEGLVTREERGRVVAVDWPNLVRRWTQDYSLMKSNTVYRYLDPRGVKSLLGKIRDVPADRRNYAVTGSDAANEIAPFAPTRLTTLYAENAERIAEELALRPVQSGANVLIAEPFDPVVFDRTWERKGVVYAALSQVAADLLTSPGRAPSEGEELIRWMQKNENEWRS